MSSPTSRAPVDPSDWAPRATRERAAMERVSSAAHYDPLTSHAPATPVESPSGGQSGKDGDLARLEDSLRWLQRQDAAFRLPRVASLPLVPGLTPPETPRLSRGEIGSRRGLRRHMVARRLLPSLRAADDRGKPRRVRT